LEVIMKSNVRFLSFILTLMLFSVWFVSCDSSDNSIDTDASSAVETSRQEEDSHKDAASSDSIEAQVTETETEPEVFPDIAKKNYGEDFFLSIYAADNPIDYHWVEESQNDAMSQSLYARQQNIYDYLGVNITGFSAGDHLGHEQVFMNAVKNKDGSVDTLVTHAYIGISGYISGGYLYDFNDIPQIDLSADYWNTDYMDSLCFNGEYYLGYSDFNIPKTFVISFNKDLLERYSDAIDEPIYRTVLDYRWTVDKMISLANTVYVDATANGKSEDDTFGITGHQWIPFVSFLKASDIHLVSENEAGDYVVSVYTASTMEKTASLVEKFSALVKNDCSWFWYMTDPTPTVNITTGRTLMQLQQSFSLVSNLNYELNFGVLPYPMYDEAQKDLGYRSLNWGGCLAVPAYLENAEKVGDTLEMLSFFSEDVTVTFYEKLLGKQVADAPDDKAMLDLVWNGICSDFGLTYSHLSNTLDQNLYMFPKVTNAQASTGLASHVKSYENAANKAIFKFLKSIKIDNN